MHERLALLDDILIDRLCQPIADRLAARRFTDCFQLARICNDAASLAWILSQAGSVSRALATGNVALGGAQAALIVIGLAALTTLRRVFEGKQATHSAIGNRGNPLRPAMFLHRLFCLIWLGTQAISAVTGPAGFSDLLVVAVSLMTTASVYIGACSSPPPERRARAGRNRIWRPAAIRRA